MNANEQLIRQFYTCFQKKDYRGMQNCYADKVIFSDSIFTSLNYREVSAMWHMLLISSSDLELTFDGIASDHDEGSCRWTALYTFTKTNRKVTNHIRANFRFENGKIISHTDAFDFWRWSRQAFGFTGFLLGWTRYFRNKVQSTATLRLKNFIEKHSEYHSL